VKDYALPYLAIDTETTGLNFHPNITPRRHPFAISACNHKGETFYCEWDVDPRTLKVSVNERDLDKFETLLRKYSTYVFHHAEFDISALESVRPSLLNYFRLPADLSLPYYYLDPSKIHDTQGMSHVLDSSGTHKLKELAMIDLGMSDVDENDLRDLIKRLNTKLSHTLDWWHTVEIDVGYWLPTWVYKNHPKIWREVTGTASPDQCQKYGVNDAVRTALLFRLYYRKLHERGDWEAYERERRLLPAIFLAHHHTQGVTLVTKNFNPARVYFQKKFDECHASVVKASGIDGFNPNSHPQIKSLLFEDWNLPVVKRTGTQAPSTDSDSVDALLSLAETGNLPRSVAKKAKNFLENFQAYQSVKTINTYVKNYDSFKVDIGPKDSRMLFRFNQWGTSTTRLSSGGFGGTNGQNVGGKEIDVEEGDDHGFVLRSLFGPTFEYIWLSIDYNQLELRLMAHRSGDKTLLKILNEGADQHGITRDAINAMRRQLNLTHDISRKQAKNINFAWQYGASDRKLSAMAGIPAAEFNAAMRSAFPGVVAEMQNCINIARQQGYIKTLGGYRLTVPRSEPYKATNYLIQGSAGDIAKNAWIGLHELYQQDHFRKFSFRVLLQIHDEFLIQAHKSVLKTPWLIRDTAYTIERAGIETTGCRTPVKVELITKDWSDRKEYKVTT